MKKIFAVAIAALCAFGASAQISPYKQFSPFDGNHFIIDGGVTYSTISEKSAQYMPLFRAGVGADIPLFYAWTSFCPSLTFESKEFTYTAYDAYVWDYDVTAMSIEAPLEFAFNITFSRKAGMQVLGGPYFGYGIAGKYSQSSDLYEQENGFSTVEYNTYGGDYPRLNRFDFGLCGGIRFIYDFMMLKLNAEIGCTNMNANERQPAYKGRSFSACFGLRLP
ncbi:MAG: outer membrane beta-barrel protein [Paludibacteraceae bacterium]|nr:outer membrane beta-barrel protein [Paludibacteraceae bacterium]